MYTISSESYRRAGLFKRRSFQLYKMLRLFNKYEIYKSAESDKYIEKLSKRAIHYLWNANDDLNILELNKRKKDFNKDTIDEEDDMPLNNLLVDAEITRIRILAKELLLKKVKTPKELKEYYNIRITSPYRINYSIVSRIYRLWLKAKVNYKAYQKLLENSGTDKNIELEIQYIIENNYCINTAKEIFEGYFNFGDEKKARINIFENLIAESIYCLVDIIQLVETMDETYIFSHSFQGSIHSRLSFWIRRYERYEKYMDKKPEIKEYSKIKKLLEQYLDSEWREQLSGYRENQSALAHYQKSYEMHSGGRAYHNMIDTMCYVKDDFNDRSDHFNIAEERHMILNGKIKRKIDEIEKDYKKSNLHNTDNYYEKEISHNLDT